VLLFSTAAINQSQVAGVGNSRAMDIVRDPACSDSQAGKPCSWSCSKRENAHRVVPLTLKSCIPGPLIAVLSAISGSGDDSVMVPFIVIAMMSVARGGVRTQNRLPERSGPGSAVEETTKSPIEGAHRPGQQ